MEKIMQQRNIKRVCCTYLLAYDIFLQSILNNINYKINCIQSVNDSDKEIINISAFNKFP